MATKLLHYRTATSGIRPTAANMTVGQFALNSTDGRIWTKKADNSLTEARQLGVIGTNFTASFTLTIAHIFSYLRCSTNSMTVTVPPSLMNPGEYLLLRYLPGALTVLTLAAGSGVTLNGTTTMSSLSTLRIQCFGTNSYDCW